MNITPQLREEWVDACRLEQLAPDRGACALIGAEQVAIFRLGTGEVLAISNYDPFSHAFVLSRGIVGSKGDAIKVASPVYKQTFDLRTGVCLDKADVRIPTYATRVLFGMVQVKRRDHPPDAPVSDIVVSTSGSAAATSFRATRPGPLVGYRIAICECRERDRLVEVLEKKGASVVACPLVTSADPEDPSAVERWVRDLAAGTLGACVFYTGEGVRRILATAERLNLRAAVVAALSNAKTVTRGPKPARALREAGILPTHPVDDPTSSGVLDALRTLGLDGVKVGMQLYPRPSTKRLVQRFRNDGFDVRPVWPYAYAGAVGEPVFQDFVIRLARGHVDIVIFTSRCQIDALYRMAEGFGLLPTVETGLLRTRIAAIGPVVASMLRRCGLRPSIVLSDQFFMRSLVKQITAASATSSAA
jgi:uroporphyrinogen-III synthase